MPGLSRNGAHLTNAQHTRSAPHTRPPPTRTKLANCTLEAAAASEGEGEGCPGTPRKTAPPPGTGCGIKQPRLRADPSWPLEAQAGRRGATRQGSPRPGSRGAATRGGSHFGVAAAAAPGGMLSALPAYGRGLSGDACPQPRGLGPRPPSLPARRPRTHADFMAAGSTPPKRACGTAGWRRLRDVRTGSKN